MRLLRKKIGHKNFRVVFLAATLVETLVQNCGVRFHQALASDKFMEEMKGVIKVIMAHSCYLLHQQCCFFGDTHMQRSSETCGPAWVPVGEPSLLVVGTGCFNEGLLLALLMCTLR